MYKGVTRSPGMVILLSIVTCFIYYYIWLWWTKEDLNKLLGREEITTVMFICSIFVPFFYLYYLYKADIALNDEICPPRNVTYSKNFILWLILDLLVGVVGSCIAMFQIQETLNKIWELD